MFIGNRKIRMRAFGKKKIESKLSGLEGVVVNSNAGTSTSYSSPTHHK